MPDVPQHNGTKSKTERNQNIIERYHAGETLAELSADYDISEQRIHQIINGRRK